MTDIPVTYDNHGRMNYHPDYHAKHGTPWSASDQQFLIDNYAKIGPEEVSFALERTIHVVMTRAHKLRRKGLMPKPLVATRFRRTRRPDTSKVAA